MPRAVDAEKKPVLLERILEHLLGETLSTLSFRKLAAALDVSTYTLVYHFGTRTALVREIIGAIATRQRGFERPVAVVGDDGLEDYLTTLRTAFVFTLNPRSLALQRLEFEAQMLEALEPPDTAVTRVVHEGFQTEIREALLALGMTLDDAVIESRLLVDTFYGIQVGRVVNRDDSRASAAFERALENHRDRILSLTAA